ncbi:hypothetical protein GOBAR_DD08546 [Gossypium barbadense]|nr:hypothetical protein GOBAR_DD08546 [Gossypium barbadense]
MEKHEINGPVYPSSSGSNGRTVRSPAHQPNFNSRAVQEALEHLASVDLSELFNEAKTEYCRATRDLRRCGRYVKYVLNSCGHASLCAECCQRCDLCPICRIPLASGNNRLQLRLFDECIDAGLISRRYELRVYLNGKTTDVTDICMDETAVSSDAITALLLDEKVVKDWVKRKFKNITTELQQISYLASLSSILEVLESSFKGRPLAQLHDLHHLQESILKTKQHLEIIMWCMRHQFLEHVRSRHANFTSWHNLVRERKSAATARAWPDVVDRSADSTRQDGSLFIEDALANLDIEQACDQELGEDLQAAVDILFLCGSSDLVVAKQAILSSKEKSIGFCRSLLDKGIELLPEVLQQQVKTGTLPDIVVTFGQENEMPARSGLPELQEPEPAPLLVPSTSDSILLQPDLSTTSSPAVSEIPKIFGGYVNGSHVGSGNHRSLSILHGRLFVGPETISNVEVGKSFNFEGISSPGIHRVSPTYATPLNGISQSSSRELPIRHLQEKQSDKIISEGEQNGFVNQVHNTSPPYSRRVTANPVSMPSSNYSLKGSANNLPSNISGKRGQSNRDDSYWTVPPNEYLTDVVNWRHSLLESFIFCLLDDHTDKALQESFQLLPEISGPTTHPKIARVLLERQNPEVAHMVLRWSGRDDGSQLVSLSEAVTVVWVKVEYRLLTEAFTYQRMLCTKVREKNFKYGPSEDGQCRSWMDWTEILVSELCCLCIRRNLVDRIIELPWNSDEEKYIHKCLLDCATDDPSSANGSLLLVFYLQVTDIHTACNRVTFRLGLYWRYRYVEAYQVSLKLRTLKEDFISTHSVNEEFLEVLSRMESCRQRRKALVHEQRPFEDRYINEGLRWRSDETSDEEEQNPGGTIKVGGPTPTKGHRRRRFAIR